MTNFHPADPSVADDPGRDDDAAPPPPDVTAPAGPPSAAGDPPASPPPPPAAATADLAPPAAPPSEPADAAPSLPVQPAAAAVAPPPTPPPAEPEASTAAAPPPTPAEPEPPTAAAPPPPLAPPAVPPEAPADAPTADGGATPEAASASRARNWQAPVAALVVVAVVVAAFFLGRSSDDSTQVTTPDTTAAPAAAGFVTFNDQEGGFTIQYPRAWERLPTPSDDPELAGSRLLVSAGKGHYLHVQVLVGNPATAKADVEQNLREEGVNILAQQDITHNGLTGYSYLYTFVDEKTGLEAKHAHYVLLRGQKAYTVVFQAMPAAEFDQLAPTFLKVIESFQSTSDSMPPVATAPTTAAASTTAPGD